MLGLEWLVSLCINFAHVRAKTIRIHKMARRTFGLDPHHIRAAVLLILSEAAKILILKFFSMFLSQEVETETETDRGYLADDGQYGRRATRSLSQHDNYRNLQVCVVRDL